jgi:RNA polymerase sigma factor (sigma-70 family)
MCPAPKVETSMNSQPSSNSLRELLNGAQAAEEDALTALWQRYYPDLVRFADKRLKTMGVPPRVADGEDVAASALGSFFRAVQLNRFQDLRDESGLLRFLFKITVWKVIDRNRKEQALKAGGGRVVGESVFADPENSFVNGINDLAANTPAPDMLASLEEELQEMLNVLGNKTLQNTACYRLEGFSNAEIAELCRCSRATVERRFHLIREIWSEAVEAQSR